MIYTDDQIDAAIAIFEAERRRWGTISHAPARAGMSTSDWMKAQEESTYDLVREGEDGQEVIAANLPDALHEAELFLQAPRAAMRATLQALGA